MRSFASTNGLPSFLPHRHILIWHHPAKWGCCWIWLAILWRQCLRKTRSQTCWRNFMLGHKLHQDSFINSLKDTSIINQDGWRQWFWQTCNEFGFGITLRVQRPNPFSKRWNTSTWTAFILKCAKRCMTLLTLLSVLLPPTNIMVDWRSTCQTLSFPTVTLTHGRH